MQLDPVRGFRFDHPVEIPFVPHRGQELEYFPLGHLDARKESIRVIEGENTLIRLMAVASNRGREIRSIRLNKDIIVRRG